MNMVERTKHTIKVGYIGVSYARMRTELGRLKLCGVRISSWKTLLGYARLKDKLGIQIFVGTRAPTRSERARYTPTRPHIRVDNGQPTNLYIYFPQTTED